MRSLAQVLNQITWYTFSSAYGVERQAQLLILHQCITTHTYK